MTSQRLRLLVAALLFLPAAPGSGLSQPQTTTDNIRLAALLGEDTRDAFAKNLQRRVVGGRTYSWQQYVDWGKQLICNGRVTNPPVGQKPSKPLSQYYRCLHCHNIAREDRRLTVQDPDAREQWLRSLKLTDPTKRDGTVPSLTVATTLWGAVNRASFYNGYHKKYHRLAVKDDEAMDPSSLTDAIEVCCRYCSSGRFPEQWELDSMLAFLWSLELRLKDVDLAPSIRRRVLSAWKNNGLSPALKNLLRKVYLRKSGATLLPMPSSVRGATDAYDDDKSFTGNAKSGQFLYATACAGCHGTVHSSVGRSLARTSDQYCRFVLRGTERDGQYMPFFTQQRLSRRQLADIRAYLQQATK